MALSSSVVNGLSNVCSTTMLGMPSLLLLHASACSLSPVIPFGAVDIEIENHSRQRCLTGAAHCLGRDQSFFCITPSAVGASALELQLRDEGQSPRQIALTVDDAQLIEFRAQIALLTFPGEANDLREYIGPNAFTPSGHLPGDPEQPVAMSLCGVKVACLQSERDEADSGAPLSPVILLARRHCHRAF